MAKIALFVFVIVFSLVLGACAPRTPLRVEAIDPTRLHGEPLQLSLIGQSSYDADIRRELAKAGFQVNRFVSQRMIEQDLGPGRREVFRESNTKFGMTVTLGRVVDWCLNRDSVLIDRIIFEIVDMRNGEIIMFIEGGGWTGPCGIQVYESDIVWPKLIGRLVDAWRGRS